MTEPMITQIADKAAAASDRWLFLFAILVLGAGAVAAFRWLVKDREQIASRLESITDRHVEQAEKLAQVVTNNTHALESVARVTRSCKYNYNPKLGDPGAN